MIDVDSPDFKWNIKDSPYVRNSDFWSDIRRNDIQPQDILTDKEQIEMVKNAIIILKEFDKLYYELVMDELNNRKEDYDF